MLIQRKKLDEIIRREIKRVLNEAKVLAMDGTEKWKYVVGDIIEFIQNVEAFQSYLGNAKDGVDIKANLKQAGRYLQKANYTIPKAIDKKKQLVQKEENNKPNSERLFKEYTNLLNYMYYAKKLMIIELYGFVVNNQESFKDKKGNYTFYTKLRGDRQGVDMKDGKRHNVGRVLSLVSVDEKGRETEECSFHTPFPMEELIGLFTIVDKEGVPLQNFDGVNYQGIKRRPRVGKSKVTTHFEATANTEYHTLEKLQAIDFIEKRVEAKDRLNTIIYFIKDEVIKLRNYIFDSTDKSKNRSKLFQLFNRSFNTFEYQLLQIKKDCNTLVIFDNTSDSDIYDGADLEENYLITTDTGEPIFFKKFEEIKRDNRNPYYKFTEPYIFVEDKKKKKQEIDEVSAVIVTRDSYKVYPYNKVLTNKKYIVHVTLDDNDNDNYLVKFNNATKNNVEEPAYTTAYRKMDYDTKTKTTIFSDAVETDDLKGGLSLRVGKKGHSTYLDGEQLTGEDEKKDKKKKEDEKKDKKQKTNEAIRRIVGRIIKEELYKKKKNIKIY